MDKYRLRRISLLCSALIASSASHAGFLNLPELTEVPELERESMLKDLDIPSVRERDPDPESGPRLNVLKFKLQGIVEYPDLGITREELENLIESIRYDLMEDYKLLPSGFTKKEVEEVSGLLGDIEEETMDRHVSEVEVQKLIWLVREQRSNRGITLGTIETVADRITRFYRERGFILAKAYIPEQKVRDGVVTLTLLLGTLGDVELEESEIYSKETIVSVFDDMMTMPVTSSAVEEDLYLINDFPGVSVVGFFEPGDQVGDTRFNLKVQNERRYQGMVRLDNHGTEQTGEYRLYAEGKANNLAGLSDQLTLGVLNSFSPDNTYYGQLKYSASVLSPKFYMALAHSKNQFVLGKGADENVNRLELAGSTESTDFSMLYKLKRNRVSTHSVELRYSDITSSLESEAEEISLDGLLDNEVKATSLTYMFDVLNEGDQRLHQGSITLLSGELDAELDLGKEEEFSLFSGDYSFLTFMKVPLIDNPTRVLLRSSWQYSEESLSSINQFSLAGPTVVKAFPVNTFSADSGLYVGVEWIFDRPGILGFNVSENLKLSQVVQPYIFADASYGVQKSLLEGVDDVEAGLADAGLGFRFNYAPSLSANLQFAYPIEKDFSSDNFDESDDGMHAVFDIQYVF